MTAPTTARSRAKAQRRHEILTAAARLMAERGFHSVRLDDIGTEVGLSGPAMYRYFDSKEAALAEMLLDISVRLRDAGLAVARESGDPSEILAGLIGVHVNFVVTEPDLIRVHFRDLEVLPAELKGEVRIVQREYVRLWVATLRTLRPDLDEVEARARAHAVFGLLNSSPRLPVLEEARTRALLARMAEAALLC